MPVPLSNDAYFAEHAAIHAFDPGSRIRVRFFLEVDVAGTTTTFLEIFFSAVFFNWRRGLRLGRVLGHAIAERTAVTQLPLIHIRGLGAGKILAKNFAIGFCVRKSRKSQKRSKPTHPQKPKKTHNTTTLDCR